MIAVDAWMRSFRSSWCFC